MVRWLVVVFTALLTACATGPRPVPADLALDEREQSLLALAHWQFSGKLGFVSAGESGSVYVDWLQQQDHYRIGLRGPLGQGGGEIAGSESGVSLIQDGRTYRADSAEALLQQRLGLPIPIMDLQYWVRALPVPERPGRQQLERDERGLLTRQHQDGWVLDYSNYAMVDGQALPGRIKASSEALGIRLNLIIKNWQLGTPGVD